MARSGEKTRPQPKPKGPPGEPSPLSAWLKTLLSAAIVWHLFVVFISPLSVQPSSEVVAQVAQSEAIRWYSDSLYLNHGYHFFGPEPPVNQLMRYAVLDDTGSVLAEGEFPNTRQQWPRLYYHRHMMLADQANLAPGASPEDSIRLSLRAYARHLLRKHEGTEVRLDCVRHEQLGPFEVLRGDDPNAQQTFTQVASVTERRSSLDQPLVPRRAAELLPLGGSP